MLRLLSNVAFREWTENVPFKVYWETTFHFSRPEVNRKQAEDMSGDISDPGKIPKHCSDPFEAYWETTFDYSIPEVSRLRVKDMRHDI
jgi:hypothetical protein